MSTMKNNTPLLFGLLMIGAAVMYTRRPVAKSAAPTLAGVKPYGAGSMPGNVGTGVAQQIGGMLGNFLVRQAGGGTATGAPVFGDGTFPMQGDSVLQNSILAADPMRSFDPTTAGDFSEMFA